MRHRLADSSLPGGRLAVAEQTRISTIQQVDEPRTVVRREERNGALVLPRRFDRVSHLAERPVQLSERIAKEACDTSRQSRYTL
jgi:hypothetical protein